MARLLPSSLPKFIQREISLCWAFIYRDVPTTLLASLIITVSTIHHISGLNPNAFSFLELTMMLFRWLIYFTLSIYSFALGNQIVGVDEDTINKPTRPLVTGRLTIDEAYHRLYICSLFLIIFGFRWRVIECAIVWIGLSYLYNFCGWDQHWMVKNLVAITISTFVQMRTSWKLVELNANHEVEAIDDTSFLIYSVAVSLWNGLTVNIQDFRDQEGDRLKKRKTCPLVMGDATARWMQVLTLITTGVASVFIFAVYSFSAWVYSTGIIAWSLALSWHLLMHRSPKEDHKAYIAYAFMLCYFLVGCPLMI